MTNPVDTTAIDAGFCAIQAPTTDELLVDSFMEALDDRMHELLPTMPPACAREVAAEQYATDSLVLSAPKEPPQEEE